MSRGPSPNWPADSLRQVAHANRSDLKRRELRDGGVQHLSGDRRATGIIDGLQQRGHRDQAVDEFLAITRATFFGEAITFTLPHRSRNERNARSSSAIGVSRATAGIFASAIAPIITTAQLKSGGGEPWQICMYARFVGAVSAARAALIDPEARRSDPY